MQWLTNVSEFNEDTLIRKLSRGNNQLIVSGRPQSTEKYSVAELEDMKTVGIYRVDINKLGE